MSVLCLTNLLYCTDLKSFLTNRTFALKNYRRNDEKMNMRAVVFRNQEKGDDGNNVKYFCRERSINPMQLVLVKQLGKKISVLITQIIICLKV